VGVVKEASAGAVWVTLHKGVFWMKDVGKAASTGMDGILFAGHNGPGGPSHPVWDCLGLHIVTWFGRNKQHFCPPGHWTLHTTIIQHKELRGVTDGVHQVNVMLRVHQVNIALREDEVYKWHWLPPDIYGALWIDKCQTVPANGPAPQWWIRSSSLVRCPLYY
jgi:hypothetical protein